MAHLIPQQRPDVNGKIVTRHVLPEKSRAVPMSPIPPVSLALAPTHLQEPFANTLTAPEKIEWEKYSKDDVEKIADFASNELDFTGNSEGMFKLYTEMLKSEHLDPEHVRELMERNDVLKHIKSAFVETNGLDTDDEWTPDQYKAREEYVQQFQEFTAASEAANARIDKW